MGRLQTRGGNGYRYFLQPLTAIHLDPINIEYKIKAIGGNINQVYFLIAVAVLIIVIACINFMNLATARSAERAREVGVRKTMGSTKTNLVYQFLIESMIISVLATVLAIVLTQIALPILQQFGGKEPCVELHTPIAGWLDSRRGSRWIDGWKLSRVYPVGVQSSGGDEGFIYQ